MGLPGNTTPAPHHKNTTFFNIYKLKKKIFSQSQSFYIFVWNFNSNIMIDFLFTFFHGLAITILIILAIELWMALFITLRKYIKIHSKTIVTLVIAVVSGMIYYTYKKHVKKLNRSKRDSLLNDIATGFLFWLSSPRRFKVIRTCYNEHQADFAPSLQFSLIEYANFWIKSKPSTVYKMKNRDGTYVYCKVAYYPLPGFKDLRALVEIKMPNGTDFREVPVHYLIETNDSIV